MSQKLKSLYESAKEFNKLDWFPDVEPRHIIFVHPETKEHYYVHFVLPYLLRIHIGEAGRYSYREYETYAFSGSFEMERYVKRQNMMEVEFCDRTDLPPQVYEEIKASGVTFRGKKKWPLFTEMTPGSVPDILEDPEKIKMFTEILKELPQILKTNGMEGKPLFVTKHGKGWTATESEWNGDSTPTCYALPYANEVKAHRIKKLPQISDTLEMTLTFLTEPVMGDDAEKAFFPTVTLLTEAQEGQILWSHIGGHSLEELSEVVDGLADFFINNNQRSAVIEVEDDILDELLTDFCQKVGIELEFDEAETALEAVEALLDHHEGLDFDDSFDEMQDATGFLLEAMLSVRPHKFSQNDQELLHNLLISTFTFMATRFQEIVPNWRPNSFKKMLNEGILEVVGPPQKTYPLLEWLLVGMEEMNMINNSKDLVKHLKSQ